ncbi:MAG: hypothetical protein LBD65_06205 [Spirochaetaceae bacterium]|nr:hypothetical protein [Spirochaetaceae bacterium]
MFRETELRFVFEIRGLRLADDWLTFYIKPNGTTAWTAGAGISGGTGTGRGYWRGSRRRRRPERGGTDPGVRPRSGEPAIHPAFPLLFPPSPAPG